MVGEKLGSFLIESILGSGAMGVVYKATHETTGKVAAVKVINSDVAQKGKTYERFHREAEILQQFRHPNIVRFLAMGRFRGTSYFAMEFVSGPNLEQLMAERGALPWKEVAELGKQVCDALQYAHEHGVVHRDLKPSNLMVTEAGQIKLTDFGIAKDLDRTALTATGRTLGTAAYMAPEQIRGTPAVSHKTDLYALGNLLYQMLTGQLAFGGSSAIVLMHAHMSTPAPRPSSKIVEIPRALDDLVIQLMAKDPADRPWDAVAVGEVLNTILQKASKGETVPMVWPSQGDSVDASMGSRSVADLPLPKRKSRRGKSGTGSAEAAGARSRLRLEILGLVLALVAIGGFIGYMLWPPSETYLFNQAEHLMASKDRHDWYKARDDYLDPLDQRFPDHPNKSQTRAWRDRILLTDTEARARVLASPVQTQISKPQNKYEERFVEFHTRAAATEKARDDLATAAIWDEMDKQLRPDDAEERPWHLLARQRADDLKKTVEQRLALVKKLSEQVIDLELKGQADKAQELRKEVLSRYGQFSEVKKLLNLPPDGVPAVPPSVPARPEGPAEPPGGGPEAPPPSAAPGF